MGVFYWILFLVFSILTDGGDSYSTSMPSPVPSEQTKTLYDVTVPRCAGGTCQNPYHRFNRKCYCDEACRLFGDCCFDWLMNAIENNKSINAFLGMNTWNKTKLNYQYFLENSVCYKLRNGTSHFYVWAISSCPLTSNSTFLWKSQCEPSNSYLEDIPVTLKSKGDTQVVFKNKYCSYCHGFEDQDIGHWRTSALCSKDFPYDSRHWPSVEEYIALYCKIAYFPPLNKESFRYCSRKNIESQIKEHSSVPPFRNQIDYTLWNMCNIYITPVLNQNLEKYANPHCGEYYNFENNDTYSCLPKDDIGDISRWHDLNLLFNFDWGAGRWSMVEQASSTCLNNEQNVCDRLICPPTFISIKEKCIENPNAILNTTDSIPLDSTESSQYTINVTLTVSVINFNFSDFPKMLRRLEGELRRFGIFIKHISIATTSRLRGGLQKNTYLINADTTSNSSFDSKYDEFVQMQRKLQLSYISIVIQMDNFPDSSFLNCVDSEVVYYDSGTMTVSNNTMYVQPDGDTFLVKLAVSRFNISFNVSSEDTVEVHAIAICKATGISLNCRLLSYTKGMYNVTGNQAFLKGSTSAIHQFEIKYGILYVCQSDNEKLNLGFINILTWVTILVSVFSLLLLLILHCILPSFCDTLHGKNLVSFSVSLLVAQVLFLASSHAEAVLCRVIAVGQHYFWLASFLWTCAMAFDLAKNLNAKTMTLPSNSNGRKCFRRYCLTVWGIPAIIIAVCISIEYSGVEFEIKYGEDQPCWIGNAKSSLIVFGIPVGLCVLFDIICFAVVLHGMETTKRATKFARTKKTGHNHCIMYSKIAILLGVTWTFGFVASLTQLEAFLYINIILNGLQGFFVFIGFVFNRSLIQMIMEKFNSKSLTPQNSS